MKTREPGIYYAQREGSMYLSGSDWAGDWRTSDVLHASLDKEPSHVSHGLHSYTCIKVQIVHYTISDHQTVTCRRTTVKGKQRFYYQCPRCKMETKRYASSETAWEKWQDMGARCIVERAIILGEVKV